ncbi:NADH:flavin oxidoreductase/NADH oxidase [Acinetobacter sp. MD2(2019)]|uniref:NADH:flavin oxidoreductase/NADH oxidase n=1 Tax=Acinetobacter sp. MD2(2019) TaxID=2605273 RepID=UPI002D1EC12D|nr:NADH:flavin oxidoreductase/NADH oxidase [Acinetobacter sp. MD2(2019)]MEB3753683.1 NADH:flavin oxidoreductase/NADH oxidase [Acinetobacter sp. MD2(2019)]
MSILFQPIQFGRLNLSNKIIIAPMCQYSATEHAEISYWHEQQWASYALSGAGLCIVEAMAVQAQGRISNADLGLWNDQQRDQVKALLSKVKTLSPMPFAVQLAHAGRKASINKPWEGGGQITDSSQAWQTVAPSAIAFHDQDAAPQALTLNDIEQIKQDFVAAAIRAVEAGFELIEIHAAHGYLLHQFLSPLSNQRQDLYGGSLENRLRLTLEITQAILAVVPENYPVGVRISATDWMEYTNEPSWDLASSLILTQQLEQLGVAYIHVSSGGLSSTQKIELEPNYQVGFAEAIKATVNTSVIAVGLITDAQQAEMIVRGGHADAIAIARAILYDPRWPWHAAASLGATIQVAPQYLRCQPQGYQQLLQPFHTKDDCNDGR